MSFFIFIEEDYGTIDLSDEEEGEPGDMTKQMSSVISFLTEVENVGIKSLTRSVLKTFKENHTSGGAS